MFEESFDWKRRTTEKVYAFNQNIFLWNKTILGRMNCYVDASIIYHIRSSLSKLWYSVLFNRYPFLRFYSSLNKDNETETTRNYIFTCISKTKTLRLKKNIGRSKFFFQNYYIKLTLCNMFLVLKNAVQFCLFKKKIKQTKKVRIILHNLLNKKWVTDQSVRQQLTVRLFCTHIRSKSPHSIQQDKVQKYITIQNLRKCYKISNWIRIINYFP